ncbi:4-coumarate--CoA ligase-like 7 [Selaginella moellendorffii]|uniref:4-coumarate--CoA ligase-like 7 n=1 Tax=Selaginella moellendorffii TaxID=88036 RepID=UPI000D1C8EB3|nr:4-coumarate--CoA ligase-like 7 [Selaginella moellendorffii]XP_024531437.1 4-coumarate--CoA ligase-like 7 [Selaginella moellendorffii]|eukprot:XP_024531436.1 4-coumarate--CoA ligase-like 7 [Selaginella moellendorffii]
MAGGGGLRYADGVYSSSRPQVDLSQIRSSSIAHFLFSSKSHGQRPALIDSPSGATMSARELEHRAISVAKGLRGFGVRQGDVVMLLSPNSLEYPVVVLGVAILGAVVTTVNPVNTSREVAKQAVDSDSKFVVTVVALADKVTGLGLPTVLIDGAPGLHRSNNSQASLGDLLVDEVDGFAFPEISLGDPAALLYSSGTTGTSKGVVLTHRNLIAAAVLHAASGPDVEPGEVYLCVIPMFHVFGLVIVTCTQLSRGVPIVVMPSFDFEAMLGAIQRFKITHVPLVPPIVIALGKSPAVKAFDLSSLREIGSGAAPLGREVINACLERFPDVKVRQGYGLTESTAIASVADPDDLEHYGSAGLLSSNTLAKVIDVGSGRPLPPNQQGEIWIHGPTIMDEYLNNPNATAETVDAEGWLHTGDLGYFDDSGNLYVVDRIKELIKYKGFQVAPAELEALLLSHSQVVDAAVIPFPDEEAGQVPLAVIVRKQGCSLDGQGVMKFVSDQVAPYKKVRKVMFIDAIPKSASGKILRRELVQMTMPVSKL